MRRRTPILAAAALALGAAAVGLARSRHLPARVLSRLAGLPPAETYDVVVDRNIPIPMPDGTVLLADHYYPRGGGKLPTVLVRSPYGRGGPWGLLLARPLAGHGFQALIQSVRGTFGSGGEFTPFRHEQADGLATIDWIRQQPWFSGVLATAGPSYLGYVQWAVAGQAGDVLRAMVPEITSTDFRRLTYPGESFALDTVLTWVHQMAHQEDPLLGRLAEMRRAARVVGQASMHLPLSEAGELAASRLTSFYLDWLEHSAPGDPWWQMEQFGGVLDHLTAPVHLIGGWYDIFLPEQVEDYLRLCRAGQQPYLTIGPWAHTSLPMFPALVRESVAWLRAQVLGDHSALRAWPVRLYVMGANEWRDFPDWPPPGYTPEPWYLQPEGGLGRQVPPASAPDRYRYDPANPTPAVGGSSLSLNSGPKDNRALEARWDVLRYTTPPLDRDVEVIGPVRAELFVRSSLAHTDFFARLCDVYPNGRSINVSDGLVRLPVVPAEPQPDGSLKVTVRLWPTAERFRRGHRIRLQVSSGAHPRYARNLGSGEPLATAIHLVPADQTVYHDPDHPSAVYLPVA